MGKKPTDITVIDIGELQDDDAFPVARAGLLQANRTTPAAILAYVQANGGGVNGGVFITDVIPTGTGNVGDKTYSSGGVVLDSCLSDTDLLTVSVLALTGHSNYKPIVTINDVFVALTASADKPVFTGSVSIDLDGETEIVARHEDGASHTCTVTMETAPAVLSASFTGGYPGSQTELKSGDTFTTAGTTDTDVIVLEIENSGACTSQAFVISGTSFSVSAVIANRGTTAQALPARVRVQKATGSWSDWFETTNTVALNNLYPSASFGTVTYPSGQGALKDSETATIAFTGSNFDSIIFSSPNSDVSIASPFEYATSKTVTRTGGSYNISTNNVRAVLTRAANNATTTANTLVRIANTPATISISTPASRLRSGGNNGTTAQNHTITITASQSLYAAPSLNAPEGTWQGGGFSGSSTTWTRSLQVSDNNAKGAFTFNSLSATNLAGVATTTISSGAGYTIGGFVFRVLTVPAYPTRSVDIGTDISNTAKLRCTNLSKGATGSLNYTYQATTAEAVDRYTITGGDTWYNCDGANASSNTTGTMQIEIEEVV
jgi:hypothetical protein